MLSQASVIPFLATTQPDQSRRFYEDVLGLSLVADEPSALVFDAGGSMLRVSKVKQFTPAPHTALGWQVESIRRFARWLIDRGIEVLRFEGMPQDDLGVCVFPNGTQVVWFKDPDGNLLSLTEFSNSRDRPEQPRPSIA
ncbi:MAG TPA: VOC family protein [Anaerolineales bacterium]|jgi:catechol 2,3-dioxygenase-like lactoylglutathione lyase family enzyme